ncbi:hypothetical protein FBULB1_8115 [Fusarium bulbicola]|nr:hypothetical protein FBULB1_8115 [Fusarium bulbicola]
MAESSILLRDENIAIRDTQAMASSFVGSQVVGALPFSEIAHFFLLILFQATAIMGQKASLVVEVEIDAPVETVKSLFKDFPRFPEWSSWSIEPVVSSKKIDDLMPMEKMKVDVKDAKLTATLIVSDSIQIP